jgi:type IV secretory pathway protease TraF
VFIKRVIGLPGETVEARGRAVLIDGTPLSEPYATFRDAVEEEGDVLGRAALVYFSREVPREEPALPGRIRWERIGQRLR